MKAEEITIEVKAKLDVSRSTAEGCLKLVEIYMNEHRDQNIHVTRNDDGTMSYEIREKERCQKYEGDEGRRT
jgi:peptide deformylase